MTVQEIRTALGPLLRSAFRHGIGSRPRRFLPAADVLDGMRALAREPDVRRGEVGAAWRVAEGRRWLLNRRLDGRSVPLVQREQAAIVARNWSEARELALLLNWCDVLPPSKAGAPYHLAAGAR